MQKFAWIRNMRIKAYPDMVRQELEVETIEGMAEYVGLKALRTINCEKFANVTSDYIQKLRAQDSCLFDVRRISYYSGALYGLSLDAHGIEIHNDFVSEQTVYEQNAIAFEESPVEIIHYGFIPSRRAEIIEERKRLIAEYIEKATSSDSNIVFMGIYRLQCFYMRI